MPNLLRKIFERPYTFKLNGYDRQSAPTDLKTGDKVEYAVTATDGLTYVIEEMYPNSNEAKIRSNGPDGKKFRVATVMLRKTE